MSSDAYESERLLGEYLLFHYGRPEEILPHPAGPVAALHFAVRAVTECVDFARLPDHARALDLGCAVGRSSFEFARRGVEVVGIDFSTRFIKAADFIRTHGLMPYTYTEEGSVVGTARAKLPAGVNRERVHFEVGDACDLRPDLGQFDVALLINLIDRLWEPRRCLARLPQLVRSGGQLVIASPFTWLEEYTPRENWLGGYYTPDKKPVRGMETLRELLAGNFEFVRTVDLPFLIREHARKYQWSISEAGIWRRL